MASATIECTTCCQECIETDCCECVPTILHGTFSAGSGTCTCLNGVTVTLTYNSGSGAWEGTFTGCGGDTDVSFTCSSGLGNWLVEATGHCTIGSTAAGSFTCDPFQVSFNVIPSGCCLGGSTLTIVE